MRVKRLEVHGFKSFKDKTVIHFDHSITGIVGPNGCGKSNIVDAFFWVMGEQSYKHMRGSGSDDLIFNGSSRHAPMGIAEATLVLETPEIDIENAPSGASASSDTTDLPKKQMKEISVTRRLYRGGEGEYFINGIPSRLRDIKELFMDTGVGAKGYSVIEQGQIGRIVNSKPEERRKLVEEAAGVAKYKARKQESLRKLEGATVNLGRLNDVIAEIERGLRSLERQASRARRYQEYKKELVEKETIWARRKAKVLAEKLLTLEKDRQAIEQEIVGIRAELQTCEVNLEADRAHQLIDQKASEDLSQQIQISSDQLTQERSALELSRNRQADLTTQIERMTSEDEELKIAITTESEKISGYQSEVAESDERLASSQSTADELSQIANQARQAAEEYKQQIEQLNAELMIGINRASQLQARTAALQEKIQNSRQRLSTLVVEEEVTRQALSTLANESDALTEQEQFLTSQITEQQEKISSHKTQLENFKSELSKVRNRRDESAQNYTQAVSKLESIKELVESFAGVNDGSKSLLDWARDNAQSDIFSLLATYLRPQAGFESALEAWLGPVLEQIIATDIGQAVRSLQDLQSSQKGRATIRLIGGSIQNSTFSRSAEQIAQLLSAESIDSIGALGSYCQLDSAAPADNNIAQMMAALLQGVWVVTEMQPVLAWIEKQGMANCLQNLGGWSLVSRDGWILHAQGTLSGGTALVTNDTSLLSRQRVMAELTEKVLENRAQKDQLDMALSELEVQLALQDETLTFAHQQLKQLEIEKTVITRDLMQARKNSADKEKILLGQENEIRQLNTDCIAAEEEFTVSQDQWTVLQGQRQDIERQLPEHNLKLQELESESRQADEAMQSARIQLASVQERHSGLQREINAIQSLITSRQDRHQEILVLLEKSESERSAFASQDESRSQRVATLVGELGALRDQLSEVRDRLEQSRSKVTTAMDRIKELHFLLDKRSQNSNHMVVERERVQSEAQHLRQNMEEKYGPGCLETTVNAPIQEEMEAPVVTAEMTAEEEQILGHEVDELREKIRKLGDVNPMAVEEFEELKKRYDYLVGERTDLESSIDNLKQAIEHINVTSKERFMRAFDAIAERFEKLFPIIFGGGSAKLSLVYPEGSTEVLDCGVDVLARPPGKKIQNIGLLSGGEKALTALSLIFAIFMVKPSPFCILDEVDAPLDDANVGRFNALLSEMALNTQFILITHNKKTMELNDTLYGVTMEDPGVSKMVSIELSE